jgi:hypothetical protein
VTMGWRGARRGRDILQRAPHESDVTLQTIEFFLSLCKSRGESGGGLHRGCRRLLRRRIRTRPLSSRRRGVVRRMAHVVCGLLRIRLMTLALALEVVR